MPGTNAGTGQPLHFQCAMCRRRKTAQNGHSDGTNFGGRFRIKITGRRQAINDGGASGRSANYRFEYDCLDCGHRGWSRHRDLERLFKKLEPPPLPVWRWQGRRGRQDTEEIVAAKTKAAVARAAGVKYPKQLFNLSNTNNPTSLATARAEPGVIFWRPMYHRGEWRRDDETD